MKRFSSFVAFAATLALPLGASAAEAIPTARWKTASESRPLRYQYKSGVNWTKHAGTLHARSQKPNGGYYYHPVCLRDGKIGMALPGPYSAGVQRWSCTGESGGQIVTNGGDFEWEIKQHVAQRGHISIYSLTYGPPNLKRVVCKAVVGSNEVPGYFDLPPAGEMPTACNVQLMGQWVALPNFYVAKAKTSGLSGLPASGDGWWTPPRDWPAGSNGADPVYQVFDQNRHALCRGKSGSTTFYAGHLVASINHAKKRSTGCKFRMPGSNSYGLSHDYDVYIGSGGSTWGESKSGSSTSFANAVPVDTGVHACQDSSGRAGWVKASTKRCYTVDGPVSGVTTFRTLMK